MASTGKKEYTLTINGVEKAVKDVGTLEAAIKSLDNAVSTSGAATQKAAQEITKQSKAASDADKEAKKLADTLKRVQQAQIGANDAQVRANQALREATREQALRVQGEGAAANSIAAMRNQLSQLRNEWKNLDVGSQEFADMTETVEELTTKIREAEMASGNFKDNVGNYQSALGGLNKVSNGIDGVTKSTMGLAQGLMGGMQMMQLFGMSGDENSESMQKLQKVIALLSVALQVNGNFLREGIASTKLAIITDKISTLQIKAKTLATTAGTKSTISATVAQKAFNLVAKANPYLLLAAAIGAVVGVIALLIRSSSKGKDGVKDLNYEIERTGRNMQAIKAESDFDIALAGAAGKSAAELRKMRLEAAKTQKAMADLQAATVNANKAATKEQKDQVLETQREAWAAYMQAYRDNIVEEQQERTDAAKQAAEDAKDAASKELEAMRAAQAEHLKTMRDGADKERAQLNNDYDTRIADLKKRLKDEDNLTAAARKAINATIASLEAQRVAELAKIDKDAAKERATVSLEITQELEDSRNSLIKDSLARQTAEINAEYDRRIAAYRKRLEEETNLTKAQQGAINELIINTNRQRSDALAKLSIDNLNARASQEATAAEDALKRVQERIKRATDRDSAWFDVQDVASMRANLDDANAALDKYVTDLTAYLKTAREAHKATLATLQKGTTEYSAEQQRYQRVVEDTTTKINDAYKEQADNAKASETLQIKYITDIASRLTDLASVQSDAASTIFKTWNDGLQVQLDALNEQLEVLNEQYDAATAKREAAAQSVEDIEARIQAAQGRTTQALKQQLADATAARGMAAREEARLAKEKEKREAEIAKKERQMRRNDLIQNIALGIADTARGVTSSLKLTWPLNLIMAAIVGAMGTVQVGIMTSQLSKLADGGLIKGRRHADGGVPIGNTGIEVEGGEFVVNRYSTAGNAELLRVINDARQPVNIADIAGVLPGAPVIVNDNSRDERIIDAIEAIDVRPVVAVTDINDASARMTVVTDAAQY
jgi:hypothetical protein